MQRQYFTIKKNEFKKLWPNKLQEDTGANKPGAGIFFFIYVGEKTCSSQFPSAIGWRKKKLQL